MSRDEVGMCEKEDFKFLLVGDSDMLFDLSREEVEM
jgi:hypothetical protein